MSSFSEYYDSMQAIDSKSYPAWPPGIQVAPGDFGEFTRQDGGGLFRYVFRREGSLATYLDEDVLETETVISPLAYSKTSGLTFSSTVKAGSNTSLPVKAKGTLSAETGVAAAYDFEPGVTHRLKNKYAAYKAFGKIGMSFDKRVIVTSVTTSTRGVAIISQSDGWSVDVSGDASALKAMRLADASVSISGEGGKTEVFRTDKETPITLQIAGRNWFGRIRPMGRDGKDVPQVENMHPDGLE